MSQAGERATEPESAPLSTLPQSLLDFWFGPPGSSGRGRQRDAWWRKDATFDDEVRARFGVAHRAAAAGELSRLAASAPGALALVILLDQVPRNIYRGEARCYRSDAMARAVAQQAIERGFDRALSAVERLFLYLPFEHSERLADQDRAVALFAALEQFPETAGIGKTVAHHREIIARFGRFPHRNATLGRATTPEEAAFLEEPDSAF